LFELIVCNERDKIRIVDNASCPEETRVKNLGGRNPLFWGFSA